MERGRASLEEERAGTLRLRDWPVLLKRAGSERTLERRRPGLEVLLRERAFLLLEREGQRRLVIMLRTGCYRPFMERARRRRPVMQNLRGQLAFGHQILRGEAAGRQKHLFPLPRRHHLLLRRAVGRSIVVAAVPVAEPGAGRWRGRVGTRVVASGLHLDLLLRRVQINLGLKHARGTMARQDRRQENGRDLKGACKTSRLRVRISLLRLTGSAGSRLRAGVRFELESYAITARNSDS